MQYFEQSARLSAVTVELIADAAAEPLQIAGGVPQGTAKAAVEALIRLLQFLADAGIWAVICIVPIGVILGLPAYFVIRASAAPEGGQGAARGGVRPGPHPHRRAQDLLRPC